MSFIHTVKRSISAKTRRGLEREMLLNNIKKGAFHHYDIVWDGKEWVAWFLDERNDPFSVAKELDERQPTKP